MVAVVSASKEVPAAGKRRPPNAGKGRQPGTPNKTTKTLKEAILHAAETVGNDGQGKDGLVGYLKKVAQEDVKAFSALLGKVLPLQVSGDPENPMKLVFGWMNEK